MFPVSSRCPSAGPCTAGTARTGQAPKVFGGGWLDALPWRQTPRRRAQPPRRAWMGEHQGCRQCEPTTLVVEVVWVLVVTDQHDVHATERAGRHRRPDGLGQVAMLTGRVDGRVDDKPP